MITHIPGSWGIGGLDRHEQRTVIDEDGSIVCVCCHECVTSKVPQMEANAKLIAMAPELLSSLKEMIAEYIGHASLSFDDESLTMAIGLNDKTLAMLRRAEAVTKEAE